MPGPKEVQLVLTFRDDGSYQLKKVVGDINTILGQGGVAAGKTGQEFNKMGQQVQQAGAGFDKFKSSFKSGMLQMAAGLGIWTGVSQAISFVTRTIRDTVEQGKAFEEAFSRIRVVSKGTAEDNEAIRQSLLGLSVTFGSATENARVLATIMREFKEYSRPEQFEFLKTAASTATAGFTTTTAAAEALTTVVKGYQMNLRDASKVGEVLVRATQLEGVEFGELTHGLTKLSTTAHEVGVSFSELIGSYLTLAERQDPQLAMMQLRMLLTNLLKPSTQAQSEAKRLGIEWSAAGVKAMGFVNWLKKLNEVTAGSAEVLDNLIPGGRQIVGMLALVGNNAKETSEKVAALNEVWNKGGAVEKAFMERLHSTSFLLDTAKELFNRFKVSIFEGFSQPLLAGVKTQEEFSTRMKELTDKVVDAGTKIGKALYNTINWLIKMKDTIRDLGVVIGTVFIASKISGVLTSMQTAINVSSNAFAGMKLATMGVAGAISGWLMPAISTFVAAFEATKWLAQITGLRAALDKMTMKVGAWGVGKVDIANLNAMVKLKELAKDTDTNIFKLAKTYGGWAGALAAVESGHVHLIPHVKTVAETTKESANYQKALQAALNGTSTATAENMTGLEGLTDAQKEHIIALNRAREEMKKYGFTFKTELQDRYDALKLGLETFKKEMTPEDYEKLRAELKKLGADLGLFNRALVDLNILTKSETSVEVLKVTTRFAGLKAAVDAGLITWEQYTGGIEQVNASLKKLDPTLTATINGIQKLGETPLPAPRNMSGVLAAAPVAGVLTPSPMLTAKEMQEALASLGPSIEYFKALEATIGTPLKVLAKKELPDFEAKFKEAMAVGGFSAENLKKAADELIQHYKDAGEKVPTWLKKMGSEVTSTWDGVAGAMVDYWTQAMAEMIKTGVNFTDVINLAWQTLASGAAKAIGNMATNALAGLGAIAGPLGSLIGSVAGSLISGIGHLLGIKSKAEKEADRLKAQIKDIEKNYLIFGKISDDTAKKIADLTKQYNAQTASLLSLNDVMADAGITIKNLSAYLSRMTQGLRDISRGSVDSTKGLTAIGESFSTLVTWAQKFGQEGSKALVTFIQYLRKLGVNIKEVDDYVYAQLETGVGGIKKMVDSFGGAGYQQLLDYKDQIVSLTTEVQDLENSKLSTREEQADYLLKKNQLVDLQSSYDTLKNTLATETAPELERISNLTVTMFNSLISQGMSMTDVFDKMADPLSALADEYKNLGITGGDAIQELFKISDVSKANKDLMNAVEGNKEVLEALGNTGFLTAASLADVAKQAGGFYDKLTMAGLTSKEALSLMAPTLEDLAYYGKQTGITLDDATKNLIEQAKAAGVFKEKGLDMATVLQEGFSNITELLSKIVENTRDLGGRKGETVYAQSGFEGTVTGPKSFYVEPGVREHVSIGPAGNQQFEVSIKRQPLVIKPTFIPAEGGLKGWVLEWVQEASDNETLLIRPSSVRGRG